MSFQAYNEIVSAKISIRNQNSLIQHTGEFDLHESERASVWLPPMTRRLFTDLLNIFRAIYTPENIL
jgi:hypothetical protein